ncbi:RNA-dependent RNA polymerase [Fatsia japonica ringspot-associated virus]|uniref:RNA-directed RNA polymerase L n=1 Tax=Fatsia japonica ringspot-associated virus TaxID=2824867 RepID=A0AAD1K4Q8_9VIRU|nr:RNA-dependent RNA polymerase [Fatsia japonica ringspot-associated virus]
MNHNVLSNFVDKNIETLREIRNLELTVTDLMKSFDCYGDKHAVNVFSQIHGLVTKMQCTMQEVDIHAKNYYRDNNNVDFDKIEKLALELGQLYKDLELKRHDLFGCLITSKLSVTPKQRDFCTIQDGLFDLMKSLESSPRFDSYKDDLNTAIRTMPGLTPDNYALYSDQKDGKKSLIFYDWKVSVSFTSEIHTAEKYYKSIQMYLEKVDNGNFLKDNHIYIILCILLPSENYRVVCTKCRVQGPLENSLYKTTHSRLKSAENAKVLSIKRLAQLDIKGLTDFYASTQMLKDFMLYNFPELVEQSDKNYFQEWVKKWKNKDFDTLTESEDMRSILLSISDDIYTNKECCHLMLGNFTDHLSTMTVNQISGLFDSYKKNMKALKYKPKSDVVKLKDYIDKLYLKKDLKYKSMLDKLQKNVVREVDTRKDIKNIEEAFEINAKDYEEKNPGCFQEDLANTKCNFAFSWSPHREDVLVSESMDYNNCIINDFREAFDKTPTIVINNPYHSATLNRAKVMRIYNLIRCCLNDFSTNTTKCDKSTMEDVANLNTGGIDVERTGDGKKWHDFNGFLTRNKNEFNVNVKGKEEERRFFYEGLREMKVNMSKTAKNRNRARLKDNIIRIKENEKDVGHSGEKQDDEENDGEQDISKHYFNQDDINKAVHKKKLIRHNNTTVESWVDQIKNNLFELQLKDKREKGKISTVYDFYAENPECLFMKPGCIPDEMNLCRSMNSIMKDIGVYSYLEDQMQISKGLMTADRFMSSTDFKFLNCSNSSMMAVAFKGDGINTGTAGVPFVMLHKVETGSLSENFRTGYTKEIYGFFNYKKNTYFLMRPQRLNQVRLLSLFKSPSKMPPCFATYLSRSEVIKAMIKRGYDKTALFDEEIKTIIKDVWFPCKAISSITNLSGMIMFDFMRYAGFLPLADYSNVKEYIAEKFDPEITNCVDFHLMIGIKRFLNKMMGISLSDKARTIVIDQEMDISGGIKDLDVVCPVTNIPLNKYEDLHNNISLGIYMLPKSMHNHEHNMKSLLSVSAEWELKMRKHFGFSLDDDIRPKEAMFKGEGPFSIDGVASILSLKEYYKLHVPNVNIIRNNIETKENLLQPCYKTSTLNSSKKCSNPKLMEISDIKKHVKAYIGEFQTAKSETSDTENLINKMVLLQGFHYMKGVMFSYRFDKSSIEGFDDDMIKFFEELSAKRYSHLWNFNPRKMTKTQHPLSVEVFVCLITKMQKSLTLRSEKVSECLYEIVKEYHGIVSTSFNSLMNMDPNSGISGKKHTFMELLEYVMSSIEQLEKYQLYLVSVFEKHQRTKTDREIYLMGMRCKLMLYLIEHSFKHIAQSDPSEAISISGDYKIKTLSNLSLTAISSYNEILSRDPNAKLSFVSADQSKWSASDMSYKYILAILMCPIFTPGERTLMIECFLMYIKYKRVVIPTDIFLGMLMGKEEYGDVLNSIFEATNGLSRNWYPVSMNWLQGNINYLSSVCHSCAMLCYKNILKQIEGVIFKIKWMVHSDDNASSMIASGNVKMLLMLFKCKSLCEFHFLTMKHHFPSFAITLNPKKTYAAESQVEFISEKFINGAVIPPYCRNLANCCTEASHQNYYDDLMSLSINLTMLARKGCPNEIIAFAYAAVQIQSLSLYSMLPGEVNDIHSILKDNGMNLKISPGSYNVPACIGGWMVAPIDMLSVLGPSCNDELIYYQSCSKILRTKNFSDFQDKVRNSTVSSSASIARELEESDDPEMKACIAIINLFRLSTAADNSETLEYGTKFQSFSSQIINLPNYVNKSLMASMPSFRDFVKEFPNLRDNDDLAAALKNAKEDYYDDYSKECRSREEMMMLYDEILKYPELTLIAPLNDRDYIRSRIMQYSSVSKRNQICNQSTEKLAIDRILRSKAKTFSVEDFDKKVSYRELIISHLEKCFKERENLPAILNILVSLISNDVNFQMIVEITDKMIVTNSNPKQNYNFRWIIPERFTRIFEGSPGLIVMKEFYGIEYLEKLGLTNIPLTENAVSMVAAMFGSSSQMMDIKCVLSDADNYSSDEFKSSNYMKRRVLASNHMISCQNKLMTLNTCCNRKAFPVYSLYNMGRTSTSNYTSFLSTVYSRDSFIFFIAIIDWSVSVSTRTLKKQTEDVSLSRALDCGMYVTDRLQGLFPSLSFQDLRSILSCLNYFSDNLDEYIQSACDDLRKDLIQIKTAHLLRSKHEMKIRMLSRSIAWLYNMNFIDSRTFNFLYKYGSKADVVYIKAESVDGEGNYDNDSTYCIATKSDHYYTTLRYSSRQGSRNILKIEVQSIKDMIFEEKITNSAKEDINKLLSKFIRDKKEVIKLASSSEFIASPYHAYIKLSSRNDLFSTIVDNPCYLTNVKMGCKIEYNRIKKEVWDTFESNDNIKPRYPKVGEPMTNLYRYVSVPEKTLFDVALKRLVETLNFINHITSLVEVVKSGSDMTEDDEMMVDALHDNIISGVNEFMSKPDISKVAEFTEKLESELTMLSSMMDESLIIEPRDDVNYKQLYTSKLLDFETAVNVLTFLSKNDEHALRTPRPTGRSINELIKRKNCVIGQYDVLGILRLVKMAEICHNNGAVLSLSFFSQIKNRLFLSPNSKMIDHELNLNHSNMKSISDYKTLSLGDIKLNDVAKKLLREQNFKVETSSILMANPVVAGIEEDPDLYNDKEVYSYICRNAKFKTKKDGHLIPSNTLLLSEILKTVYMTVDGTEEDMEVIIRRMFSGPGETKEKTGPRLYSLISFSSLCSILSKILFKKSRNKEAEIMMNLGNSINNLLGILKIDISPNKIYDYDDEEVGEIDVIMNKIFKTEDLLEINKFIDYLSNKSSIFKDSFMFLDARNKTIDLIITSCKTLIYKQKELKMGEKTTIRRISKFLGIS